MATDSSGSRLETESQVITGQREQEPSAVAEKVPTLHRVPPIGIYLGDPGKLPGIFRSGRNRLYLEGNLSKSVEACAEEGARRVWPFFV